MSQSWDKYRDKIIGLGDHSLHKSYYPELQEKLDNLELSQKNLQTILNSISDAIIIHDEKGRILYLNKQAQDLYNIKKENAQNYTIEDISSPNQDTSKLDGIWEKVMSNIPQVIEWKAMQIETEKEFPVQVSISPTLWNEEKALVAVVRDFTERKKFEKQLIFAKEKAEQANKLKTEFLNNMSHEVRTPMNGIIGFAEMLTNPDLSHEKRKYFAKIVQNSSFQLLKIIDNILEISTLETKQIKVSEEEFSINDLLMELYSIFGLKSSERSIPIYLKKSLKEEDSIILSDRSKLMKILDNLIENALKFTNEGYIELGYTIKNDILSIYVKDTGVGILQENMEDIFERFTQEEKELSRKHGGLGLGLSISKENAQLLGGEILVESEKGKGSVFYLNIPYKPVINRNISAESSLEVDVFENGVFNILVAEDEEINFLFIEALFEMESKINLIHAKNGREAVDLCETHKKIDLILMDIKMPILNGLDATKEIKSKSPEIPIIAQTAYSTIDDRELALKNGCDDFISKPLNIDIFYSLINKYLGTELKD